MIFFIGAADPRIARTFSKYMHFLKWRARATKQKKTRQCRKNVCKSLVLHKNVTNIPNISFVSLHLCHPANHILETAVLPSWFWHRPCLDQSPLSSIPARSNEFVSGFNQTIYAVRPGMETLPPRRGRKRGAPLFERLLPQFQEATTSLEFAT